MTVRRREIPACGAGFNVAVDGTVGYHAVVVIKMVQQLLAGEHFSGS